MFKELTIERLLQGVPTGGVGVSIYLSKTGSGSDVREERTKLKAQLKVVQSLLEGRVLARESKQILSAFQAGLQGGSWVPRAGSVGLFYSGETRGYIKIPFRTQERSFVADSFHLKPVFKWLYAQQRFYLLLLHAHESTLYRGSSFGLECMARERAPYHKPSRGNRPSGLSASDITQKAQKKFISTVGASVLSYLQGETTPLLLAGSERLCAGFSEVCGYPFLLEERIPAGGGADEEEKLHQRALEKLAPYAQLQEQLAIDDFASAVSRKQAVTDLNEVARALQNGRVRRLFVAEDTYLTGKIHREQNALTLVTRQADGDDFLDDLAELAAAHRSQILVLPRKRMPGNAAAAATLRW